MRFQHSQSLQMLRFYPAEIVIPIYMEKILAQLYPIRQEAPTFAIAKINRTPRGQTPQIYRQTFKKNPFQGVFSGFSIF